MSDLVEPIGDRLTQALQANIMADEPVLVSLAGGHMDALVCTDRRILVLKGGSSTGRVFQAPYRAVTAAEVHFGIVIGYFQLGAGGVPMKRLNTWSKRDEMIPTKQPNCVFLRSKSQADRFRMAASFIMQRCAAS